MDNAEFLVKMSFSIEEQVLVYFLGFFFLLPPSLLRTLSFLWANRCSLCIGPCSASSIAASGLLNPSFPLNNFLWMIAFQHPGKSLLGKRLFTGCNQILHSSSRDLMKGGILRLQVWRILQLLLLLFEGQLLNMLLSNYLFHLAFSFCVGSSIKLSVCLKTWALFSWSPGEIPRIGSKRESPEPSGFHCDWLVLQWGKANVVPQKTQCWSQPAFLSFWRNGYSFCPPCLSLNNHAVCPNAPSLCLTEGGLLSNSPQTVGWIIHEHCFHMLGAIGETFTLQTTFLHLVDLLICICMLHRFLCALPYFSVLNSINNCEIPEFWDQNWMLMEKQICCYVNCDWNFWNNTKRTLNIEKLWIYQPGTPNLYIYIYPAWKCLYHQTLL